MSLCSWPAIDKTIGLKVCTEYNYVNVTRMDNIPYFLVAGPAGFRCYLHKSDPTAKDYVQTHNVTLLLQSGAGTVLARGKYKNTQDEKFIQVALDINNKKHFDALASIKRTRIKNGFSYNPMVYLGVNNDRVLKFSGKIIDYFKFLSNDFGSEG
nr:unnamed protein product [Callosobruchus chinensis]